LAIHAQPKRAGSSLNEDWSAISPLALAAGKEILFEVAKDLADWAGSHCAAATQCAHRGEIACLSEHLNEARSALKGALRTLAELEAELVRDGR
jgi:hypothetical protein